MARPRSAGDGDGDVLVPRLPALRNKLEQQRRFRREQLAQLGAAQIRQRRAALPPLCRAKPCDNREASSREAGDRLPRTGNIVVGEGESRFHRCIGGSRVGTVWTWTVVSNSSSTPGAHARVHARRGGGSWLADVADDACRDVGNVPVELLGDYLPLLADAATTVNRPLLRRSP